MGIALPAKRTQHHSAEGLSVANEKKTEKIVLDRLNAYHYYTTNGVIVEYQTSDLLKIKKLLENASKKGDREGHPEFIIRSTEFPNFLIVIECKASTTRHQSATRDKYAEYAVDGVLLYAAFLVKEYDVLAIAVSGETEATLRISHFLHLRGAPNAVEYPEARDIVSFDEYYQAFIHSDAKFRQDYQALLDYSRRLNNTLQARKVVEADRAFLISGILIALQNDAFKRSFRAHRTAKQLATSLLKTIRDEFENADLPQDRREGLIQAFSFISHTSALQDDKSSLLPLSRALMNTSMRLFGRMNITTLSGRSMWNSCAMQTMTRG